VPEDREARLVLLGLLILALLAGGMIAFVAIFGGGLADA
jgi:hypothetical protein